MSEKLTKVEFTNLSKVLYPQLKVTKAQVIDYYIKMAPRMLDLLADRPMVLTRFPDGINKEGFYEKDAPLGTPNWVKRFKKYSETAKREISYVVCDDLDTLIWLANLAAIEMHMTLSRTDSFEHPDLVLFDLDPKTPGNHKEAVEVALLLKERLDALSLASYIKTSGKKGLHIVTPIAQSYTFKQTREFAHKTGEHLAKQTELIVTDRAKSDTPGKVYIDYVQNSHGRTMICPYSLRATSHATVSAPLEWNDVKKELNPEELNLFNVPKSSKNPWQGIFEHKQKLEVD
jgi:bifunctional non-homologous end joining protein LigD